MFGLGETEWLLAGLFLLVAVLYSSVGHAGASGYLAAMALLGFAPEQMRPTALALNLLVGGIGLVRFWRVGLVDFRKVLPFVVASAPAAFLAAQYPIPRESYSLLLGGLLLFSAVAVFRSARHLVTDDSAVVLRPVRWLPALGAGAAIGVLSGLTGTGGAIFLTPLLLLMRWSHTREASGISVAFVWINSALGLAGLWKATGALPAALPAWLIVVGVGALVGTQLGIHRLPLKGLRYALSLVLLIAAGKLLLG
ncbi:sulfite exporter TauE/SafE family protein [Arenimonas daejeonensis]|uniref:sulfite exporter TauE/SafE family protein n=1 Tax=Arenimonas daejeonensis TaxID=370777 RepID=UPI001D136398|nr:sulfite exporter TauE/SafE family protein [Arenimonas daejeonensis]